MTVPSSLDETVPLTYTSASSTQAFEVSTYVPSGFYFSRFASGNLSNLTFEVTAGVPEPATWTLMLVGLAGLGGILRGQCGKRVTRATWRPLEPHFSQISRRRSTSG
jgi:hypothetical protein